MSAPDSAFVAKHYHTLCQQDRPVQVHISTCATCAGSLLWLAAPWTAPSTSVPDITDVASSTMHAVSTGHMHYVRTGYCL
eukprot:3089057-Rhodomonas_salina.3